MPFHWDLLVSPVGGPVVSVPPVSGEPCQDDLWSQASNEAAIKSSEFFLKGVESAAKSGQSHGARGGGEGREHGCAHPRGNFPVRGRLPQPPGRRSVSSRRNRRPGRGAARHARALDLLILMVRRQGDLVSKNEITSAIWPGTVVEDSNLPTQISTLRRVLDRGRSNGSCIQTVAGRGYRFVAVVTHHPAEERSSSLNGTAGRAEDDAPNIATLLPASRMPVAAAPRRPTAGTTIAAAVGVALVS